MENGLILDAITHAVRAVERRSDGLQPVADRHSAASKAALDRIIDALAAPCAPSGAGR